MDKETNNQQAEINPSLLPNTASSSAAAAATTGPKEESPRKPISGGGGGGGGDRLKRDEWSEGAVSSLLEAYESKWILRNRAKLKGHDWEDVAKHVSSRANCSKSRKTQTQCKNKIESMKKRYRSESTADASSWPLYSRLDLLLRGSGPPPAVQLQMPPAPVAPPMPPDVPMNNNCNSPFLVLVEPTSVAPPMLLPPQPTSGLPPPLGATAQNSHGSNGVERAAKEDGAGNKNILSDHASDKNINSMEITSDSSTPALYSEKAEKMRSTRSKTTNNKISRRMEKKMKRKRVRDQELEIAESIRWLAEAVVKSEQARMEAMREIERMRVEAEAKRAEMDLKRTEIIANTQLEIARLFAGKAVDSSLRIGRN